MVNVVQDNKGLIARGKSERTVTDWEAFDSDWKAFDWAWPEVLRQMLAQIETLKAEISGLRGVETTAKQVIKDLLADCPACGEKMLAIDWNKDVYILTCHNLVCTNYHQPLKNLRKENLATLRLSILKECDREKHRKSYKILSGRRTYGTASG